MFSIVSKVQSIKSGFDSVPLISDFINHAYKYFHNRLYYLKPTIIRHYQKLISLCLMISYKEKEMVIGYRRGKTIRIESWVFSLENWVSLSTQLVIKEYNIYRGIWDRMLGESGLIRTTRSWHRIWIVFLGSSLILLYRIRQLLNGGRELNIRRINQIQNIWLCYCLWEIANPNSQ